MWWIIIAVIFIAVVLWMVLRPYKYWIEKGVKQATPTPIFGDRWGTVLRKQSLAEMVQMVYNAVPNTRYSGFYQFFFPTLVVKDPELIKQITIKDFEHFVDHKSYVPEDSDPLWAANLFALTGRRWREMRATLSPAFTSSKMKFMFSLISENAERFVNHFLKRKEEIITVEMKDTFTRFTNDVIANTVFGVECDSLGEPENEFYLMGKELTDFSGLWKYLKLFSVFLFPKLYKIFKIQFFASQVSDFFTRVVKSNIESRQKHGIVRTDMIHLLLEARKHGLKHEDSSQLPDTGFATVEESDIGKNSRAPKIEITDQIITSQAMSFFFAGFDSVSALMCFMSYELGVNQEVQARLIQEVDETLDTYQGKITYEALLGMKYMDMVVSETLRKWPSSVAVDRICTKPYTIEPKNPDEKPVHLEKETLVWLPIFALHRDPQYFPDPERFDPERFSDENKANIKPYTYIPFGSGPRNCIGSRFALFETKILFFHILSKFEIVPVEKTRIPLKLFTLGLSLTAEGGFWFGFKRRDK